MTFALVKVAFTCIEWLVVWHQRKSVYFGVVSAKILYDKTDQRKLMASLIFVYGTMTLYFFVSCDHSDVET